MNDILISQNSCEYVLKYRGTSNLANQINPKQLKIKIISKICI